MEDNPEQKGYLAPTTDSTVANHRGLGNVCVQLPGHPKVQILGLKWETGNTSGFEHQKGLRCHTVKMLSAYYEAEISHIWELSIILTKEATMHRGEVHRLRLDVLGGIKARLKLNTLRLQSPTFSIISLSLGRGGVGRRRGRGVGGEVGTGVRRGHPSCASQGLVAMRHSAMSPAQA